MLLDSGNFSDNPTAEGDFKTATLLDAMELLGYQIVNVGELDRFEAGSEINVETLLQSGMINNLNRPVKLLGEGTLSKQLKITVHACSGRAKEIVEKAGGEVNIIS